MLSSFNSGVVFGVFAMLVAFVLGSYWGAQGKGLLAVFGPVGKHLAGGAKSLGPLVSKLWPLAMTLLRKLKVVK